MLQCRNQLIQKQTPPKKPLLTYKLANGCLAAVQAIIVQARNAYSICCTEAETFLALQQTRYNITRMEYVH